MARCLPSIVAMLTTILPVHATAGNSFTFLINSFRRDSVLWVTDGTTAGTVALKRFREARGGGEWKGRSYFCADDGVHGLEPWRTDGTAEGTSMLKDLNEGKASSEACAFVPFRGALYFLAEDAQGQAIWKTDGSRSGTVKLPRLSPGDAAYYRYLSLVPGVRMLW